MRGEVSKQCMRAGVGGMRVGLSFAVVWVILSCYDCGMNQCQFCKPLDRQNIALIESVTYGCFYCTVIMTTVRVLCMYNQPLRGA